MPDSPNEAFLPEEYAINIMHTLGAACGVTAFHLALEDRDPDERREIKENLLKSWLAQWRVNFGRDITEYNETLSKTTNAHKLPQPEEYQLGFNRIMAVAEQTARVALRMNEDEEDGE